MNLTTHTFNFVPDAYLTGRIQLAAKGDWDASIDLCMANILYDEERAMWVKVPEPDFDRRRSGGYDTGQYDIYLQHEARLMDGFPYPNEYSIWHCNFNSLLQDDRWQFRGDLASYGFVMKLYDAGFDAQEAAEIFVRADAERYARLAEGVQR